MRALLASPRRRRRLLWLGGAAAAVGVVAALVVLDPGGVDPPPTAAPEERSAPVLEQPRAEPEYEPIRVTATTRREIDATVDRFVSTAVVRRNLDAAWALASPDMRAGVSREEWLRGDLPVVPYPAAAVGAVDWQLGYVDRSAVVVDVMIQPKPRSGERVQIYSVQLRRADGRWLVDSWIPSATLGAAGAPQARPGRDAPAESPQLAFDDSRLSAWYFLVPAFFLALLVFTPIVLLARGALNRRRAERRYHEWSAGRTP